MPKQGVYTKKVRGNRTLPRTYNCI